MNRFIGRFRSRDLVPASRAASEPEEKKEDEEKELGRFNRAEMDGIISSLRIRMADGAKAAMARFKAASARRRGVGDAKARQRTADEATLRNPTSTSMQRLTAQSRLLRRSK